MSIARKIFMGRVLLPGTTPTSLATLMRDSALHWGLEADLTTPSLDSITGSEVIVKPDSAVRYGSDSSVGVLAGNDLAGGATLSLVDDGAMYGVLDPNQIYFFATGSAVGMQVIFTAR